jgi:hypothetical protein
VYSRTLYPESWKHCCNTGALPASHEESVITLLPKEGKDIKNWRPITLSNCDSKFFTKALAIKMSKVLDDVMDPNQSEYIRGRSRADKPTKYLVYEGTLSGGSS